MALLFSTGDNIHWGSHSILSNSTVMAWVKVDSTATFQGLWRIDPAGDPSAFVFHSTPAGEMQFTVNYDGGANAQAPTNNLSLTADVWRFIAFTHSNPSVQVYHGSLTSGVVESSYAGGKQDGTGSLRTGSANMEFYDHDTMDLTLAYFWYYTSTNTYI